MKKENLVRVIIPDSHGSLIDKRAATAFLSDLKRLDPDEIVLLGDHIDAGGLFSAHHKQSHEDQEYSYHDDIKAGNWFLDKVQEAAPSSRIHYLEGNHEYHIERWALNNMLHDKDIKSFIQTMGPAGQLKLKDRGISFYRRMEFYHGCSLPNTIKLGKCFFTHGICAGKYATSKHVERFSANIVHGHTHRAQSHFIRTVSSGVIGGWCPGTLAKLQMLYNHTNPTDHSHGFAFQIVAKSGIFQHVNVAIVNGTSFCSLLM